MKLALVLAFAAALLLTPGAVAQAPTGATITKEIDSIEETADVLQGVIRLEFKVTDANAFHTNARWDQWVVSTDPAPTFTVDHNRNSTSVPADRVTKDVASGPYTKYHVDLRNYLNGLKSGDNVSLITEYDAPQAAGFNHQLAYATPQLVVFAVPLEGNLPVSQTLGEFFDTGESFHAIVTNPAAGFAFNLTFEPAAVPQPPRDINPYLWGAGGLLVGILLGVFWARRGRRERRFEKGGTMESKAMLEARRRTLMAALKELEVAHEAKEIPDNAYAPLKEEYKAQAVRVMRTLEEKQEPPTGGA